MLQISHAELFNTAAQLLVAVQYMMTSISSSNSPLNYILTSWELDNFCVQKRCYAMPDTKYVLLLFQHISSLFRVTHCTCDSRQGPGTLDHLIKYLCCLGSSVGLQTILKDFFSIKWIGTWKYVTCSISVCADV